MFESKILFQEDVFYSMKGKLEWMEKLLGFIDHLVKVWKFCFKRMFVIISMLGGIPFLVDYTVLHVGSQYTYTIGDYWSLLVSLMVQNL